MSQATGYATTDSAIHTKTLRKVDFHFAQYCFDLGVFKCSWGVGAGFSMPMAS